MTKRPPENMVRFEDKEELIARTVNRMLQLADLLRKENITYENAWSNTCDIIAMLSMGMAGHQFSAKCSLETMMEITRCFQEGLEGTGNPLPRITLAEGEGDAEDL